MTSPTPLTKEQIRAIAYIEQYWYQKQEFPPSNALSSQFPDFDLSDALALPVFRRALDNRGIVSPVHVNAALPAGLTTEQFAAITKVLDWDDKRSRSAKLRDIGVTTLQWAGWLKQPKFKKFLQEMSVGNLESVVNVAHEGLMKAVDRGDTNAVKLYLEVTGRYTQDAPTLQNIRVVVAQLTEAIQRHVKDPETLRKIAEDFQYLLSSPEPKSVVSHRQLEVGI